jgi:galactokinase
LQNGDISGLGLKMFQSHVGLSIDYEVSCMELDFLVSAVKKEQGVAGARMMGGGFGGCTINIIEEKSIDRIVSRVSDEYKNKTGLDMETYIVETGHGADRLTTKQQLTD